MCRSGRPRLELLDLWSARHSETYASIFLGLLARVREAMLAPHAMSLAAKAAVSMVFLSLMISTLSIRIAE